MLKTTSEELACPREDLSVARKDELRKLLLEQVPAVLGLLTGEQGSGQLLFIKDGGRLTPPLRLKRDLGSNSASLVCRYPRDLLGQTQHHCLHPAPFANLRGKW